MKTTLLHRAARSACVALLLLLGTASSADAVDAFWQGRRDRLWHHGIGIGGVSNWYSKAPLQGVARRVPDGQAVFARDAKEHIIKIGQPGDIRITSISSMLFLSNTERYTFNIQSILQITGTGISNHSPAPPHFIVSGGGLFLFRGSAGLISRGLAVGKRSASIEIRKTAGRLIFNSTSRGGNAEVVNDGGFIYFNDRSSAENMTITNVGDSFLTRTSFSDRSTGGSARFVNQSQGTLDFSTTVGPAGDRNVSAGSIYNAGDLRIGLNTLQVNRFEQPNFGGANLHIDISVDGKRNGNVSVKGKAFIGGDLHVTNPNALPGSYLVLYAEGGRTGTFTLGNVNMGRLAYSANEVRLIVDR